MNGRLENWIHNCFSPLQLKKDSKALGKVNAKVKGGQKINIQQTK